MVCEIKLLACFVLFGRLGRHYHELARLDVHQLDIRAIEHGFISRVIQCIFVILDFNLATRLLHLQLCFKQANLFVDVLVLVDKLLKLVLLVEDLVIAILYVVRQFGANLEDHSPLIGNSGQGIIVHFLNDEVDMVVADGGEESTNDIGVETNHVTNFEERTVTHLYYNY